MRSTGARQVSTYDKALSQSARKAFARGLSDGALTRRIDFSEASALASTTGTPTAPFKPKQVV